MSRPRPALAFVAAFILSCAASVSGQQSAPVEGKYSLGVSLEVSKGHAIAFPVQPAGSSEDNLPAIPMPGATKVSGIRIYPFMSGDQVAVRVVALLPARSSVNIPNVRPIGEYVIGHLGDSLKLKDVTKLGLQPLALTVVTAPFATDVAEDPCCFNNDGLICCGATIEQLCANCPDCCGGFKTSFPRSSQAQCINQRQAATMNLKSKLALKKPN